MTRLLAWLCVLSSSTAFASGDAGRCPALASGSGFEWTATEGEDFDVCYAHRPGETNALFGLYIGRHASFQGRADMTGEPGTVAGRSVRWFPDTGKDGDFPYGQQALFELAPTPRRSRLQVHVWIVARTAEEQRTAKDALRSMALPR